MQNEQKYRIFFKKEGGIIVEHPGEKYRNCPDQMPIHEDFKELKSLILTRDEIKEFGITGSNLDQIYEKNKKLKIDMDWSTLVMPANLIKSKYIQRLNTKIQTLLSEKKPDVLEIVKAQFELSTIKDLNDQDLYKLALKVIEEEKIDKPVITKKIKAKIEELSNENSNVIKS